MINKTLMITLLTLTSCNNDKKQTIDTTKPTKQEQTNKREVDNYDYSYSRSTRFISKNKPVKPTPPSNWKPLLDDFEKTIKGYKDQKELKKRVNEWYEKNTNNRRHIYWHLVFNYLKATVGFTNQQRKEVHWRSIIKDMEAYNILIK